MPLRLILLMTDKFKDHFAKIGLTMIGKDRSLAIIRNICMDHKIPAKQMRKIQNEILSCEYIQEKEKEIVTYKINELYYER